MIAKALMLPPDVCRCRYHRPDHAVWGRNLDTDAGQDGDGCADDGASGDDT
jgi:hypothetical protein